MNKPNNIEKELNAIRVDFYEKTKGMSPSEMNAYIKAQVTPFHQKHGIQTIHEAKTDHGRRAAL